MTNAEEIFPIYYNLLNRCTAMKTYLKQNQTASNSSLFQVLNLLHIF